MASFGLGARSSLLYSMNKNSCCDCLFWIALLRSSFRLACVPDSRSSSIAFRHRLFLCGIRATPFSSRALPVSIAPLSRQETAFYSQIRLVCFSRSASDANDSTSRPNCIVSLMIALQVTSESACSASTASASH